MEFYGKYYMCDYSVEVWSKESRRYHCEYSMYVCMMYVSVFYFTESMEQEDSFLIQGKLEGF